MRKLRLSLSCLGVLALTVSACGRGDDSGSDTTAPAATPAPTTAAAAATTPETTAGGESPDTTAGESPDTTAGEAPTTTAAPGGDFLTALTAADIADQCASEPLQATEIGVTEDKITIEVMADVGSPLAPGLFQGNFDAMEGFADYINANGGIGCRQLEVKTWDSKLDANESKNGLIDACQSALAMVGSNALFNPDMTPLTGCLDQAGAPTGVPDMAALANDVNQLCGATTFTIQFRSEECPVNVGQPRNFTVQVGAAGKLAADHPEGLHGLFLVPGDLPTTRQSAIPNIEAQKADGIVFDAAKLVSGRAEQSAYTPLVQELKASGGNYVYNGSNDATMMKMQLEAQAQGVDPSSIVWTCSLACYTKNFRENGGSASNGTYVWMQFLPFEEADTNAALQTYADSVDEPDSFGAQAWQAAIAFQTAVNQLVADQGPNSITRANLIEAFAAIEDFSADGWAGPRSLRGISACYVLMQLQGSEFVRVHPEERGTMDCADTNLTELTVEPVAAAEGLD
jgi:ABC-type branched-subunit amino acid transport system substrate-binding protein